MPLAPGRRKTAVRKVPRPRVAHAEWPVGEARMAVVPVMEEWLTFKSIFRPDTRRWVGKRGGKAGRRRYAVVLAEKTGPSAFKIVKKCIAPYDTPQLEQRIIVALAIEFGCAVPAKLFRLDPKDVSGLSA